MASDTTPESDGPPKVLRALSNLGRRRPGENLPASWISSLWFWTLVLIVVLGLPLYRSLTVSPPKMPPVYSQVAAFTATDQDGQLFSSAASLQGAVTIVNFSETPCLDDACKHRMQNMAELQNRIVGVGMSVRLLTFGKDPARDTPAAMRELGVHYVARFRQWTYLSGPIPAGLEANDDFYLLDQLGRVRTKTPLTSRDALNLFVRDLAIVINANSALE